MCVVSQKLIGERVLCSRSVLVDGYVLCSRGVLFDGYVLCSRGVLFDSYVLCSRGVLFGGHVLCSRGVLFGIRVLYSRDVLFGGRVLYNRGVLQLHLLIDKVEEALKDFQKSVTLSPEFAVAHVQKCYTGVCDSVVVSTFNGAPGWIHLSYRHCIFDNIGDCVSLITWRSHWNVSHILIWGIKYISCHVGHAEVYLRQSKKI